MHDSLLIFLKKYEENLSSFDDSGSCENQLLYLLDTDALEYHINVCFPGCYGLSIHLSLL